MKHYLFTFLRLSCFLAGMAQTIKGRIFNKATQRSLTGATNSFASLSHGQNLTRSEPLRRVPPLNGYFSLKYDQAKFYVKDEMAWADTQGRLAAGDKDDNRIPLGGTPGWTCIQDIVLIQYT